MVVELQTNGIVDYLMCMLINISINKLLLKKNIDLVIQIAINMLFQMLNHKNKEIMKLKQNIIVEKYKNGHPLKNLIYLVNISMLKFLRKLLILTSLLIVCKLLKQLKLWVVISQLKQKSNNLFHNYSIK